MAAIALLPVLLSLRERRNLNPPPASLPAPSFFHVSGRWSVVAEIAALSLLPSKPDTLHQSPTCLPRLFSASEAARALSRAWRGMGSANDPACEGRCGFFVSRHAVLTHNEHVMPRPFPKAPRHTLQVTSVKYTTEYSFVARRHLSWDSSQSPASLFGSESSPMTDYTIRMTCWLAYNSMRIESYYVCMCGVFVVGSCIFLYLYFAFFSYCWCYLSICLCL